MGPEEAAYAIKNFLTSAHTVIPMHFQTFPALTGDHPALVNELNKLSVTGKRVVNSYEELLGQWMNLSA